jgi:CheY-like chemotaxis protein
MSERASRVLVVEDGGPLRSFLVELLREEGYTVREAPDGAEAITILDDGGRDSIALIVLDMHLPTTDGLAVLEHLAGSGLMVPVIAMSAVSEMLIAARAGGARWPWRCGRWRHRIPPGDAAGYPGSPPGADRRSPA